MKHARTYILAIAILLISFCAASASENSPGSVVDLRAGVDEGKVKLEWCKPKDTEGNDMPGLFTYEIYRKNQSKGLVEADIVKKNKIGIFGSDGGCLTFTDTAVKSGNSYSYAVIVVDRSGNRSVISKSDQDNGSVAKLP